jgi:hypothetical protein
MCILSTLNPLKPAEEEEEVQTTILGPPATNPKSPSLPLSLLLFTVAESVPLESFCFTSYIRDVGRFQKLCAMRLVLLLCMTTSFVAYPFSFFLFTESLLLLPLKSFASKEI